LQSPSRHNRLPPSNGRPHTEDTLLMTARKGRVTLGLGEASHVVVTMGSDDLGSPNNLGTLRSTFGGLKHKLMAPNHFRDANGQVSDTNELASIQFKINRFTARGPRCAMIALPQVRRDPVGARLTRIRVDHEIRTYAATVRRSKGQKLSDFDEDIELMDMEEDDWTNPNVNPNRIDSTSTPTSVERLVTNHVLSSVCGSCPGDSRYLYTSGILIPYMPNMSMLNGFVTAVIFITISTAVLYAQAWDIENRMYAYLATQGCNINNCLYPHAFVYMCLRLNIFIYLWISLGSRSKVCVLMFLLALAFPPVVWLVNTLVAVQIYRAMHVKNTRYEPGAVYAHNTPPSWCELIGRYTLNFEGRIKVPSSKNTTFTMVGVPGTALRFGSAATKEELLYPVTGVYTMDFRFPFSPLQAFAVGMSICEKKLLVE
jgi:hypothetical protein